MTEAVRRRLEELGVDLPALPEPRFAYLPGVITNGPLVFVSGQTPTVDGVPVVTGRCGAEVSTEQAALAARLVAVNLLAELDHVAGLENISRIVKVTGYVASTNGFIEQPRVVDGASELLAEVFGDIGRHARAAIGVALLPGNAPVEVELVAELRQP
ncbi:RidA family protein [Saccharothrix obliqua]|uniref:RidA family protein n=1 Tax=Saccharothrix obliqua TaxID=2861747 RepID=UPI001C5DFB8A|nr:RidA family protein [Saccharothrix obliqua]MBW4721372.1 RidA family protein [Saccharothrix obliqua]